MKRWYALSILADFVGLLIAMGAILALYIVLAGCQP